MGFSAKQLQALRRNPSSRRIRTREANGRALYYLEGWYTISEANRIFGFDGWSRETFESRCALARENRGTFLAIYVARVRITVHADGVSIIREGHGTGEGRGPSPAEVHDIALKAAETDATKRALATFGKPFGLELYRGDKTAVGQKPLPAPPLPTGTEPRFGFHPDDTTPFHGRRVISAVVQIQWPNAKSGAKLRRSRQPRRFRRLRLISFQVQSTRAFSTLPSPSGFATRRIYNSLLRSPVLFADASPQIRITCGSPSHGRLG
jgi:hypothetical protein